MATTIRQTVLPDIEEHPITGIPDIPSLDTPMTFDERARMLRAYLGHLVTRAEEPIQLNLPDLTQDLPAEMRAMILIEQLERALSIGRRQLHLPDTYPVDTASDILELQPEIVTAAIEIIKEEEEATEIPLPTLTPTMVEIILPGDIKVLANPVQARAIQRILDTSHSAPCREELDDCIINNEPVFRGKGKPTTSRNGLHAYTLGIIRSVSDLLLEHGYILIALPYQRQRIFSIHHITQNDINFDQQVAAGQVPNVSRIGPFSYRLHHQQETTEVNLLELQIFLRLSHTPPARVSDLLPYIQCIHSFRPSENEQIMQGMLRTIRHIAENLGMKLETKGGHYAVSAIGISMFPAKPAQAPKIKQQRNATSPSKSQWQQKKNISSSSTSYEAMGYTPLPEPAQGVKITVEHFSAAFVAYETKIYKFVFHLLGNKEQAHDITQDVFTKFYKYLANGTTVESLALSAMLYRIASNTATDALRRRQLIAWLPLSLFNEDRGVGAGMPGMDDNDPDAPEAHNPVQNVAPAAGYSGNRFEDGVVNRDLVKKVLDQLPEDSRIPLLLYEHEGYSTTEIAQKLSLTPSAVKMRLMRAREAFIVLYKQEIAKDQS